MAWSENELDVSEVWECCEFCCLLRVILRLQSDRILAQALQQEVVTSCSVRPQPQV